MSRSYQVAHLTGKMRHMLAALLLLCQADIVVFVLDDVAAADLAIYGGTAATPNLAALAAQGVTFTRCYSNPTCSPSRRSLLTGHWWVRDSGEACADAEANSPTLAEAFLPEALPHTSGLIGKWHLGGNPYPGLPWELAPIAHGFDYWTSGMPANVENCGGSTYWSWMRVTASASLRSSAISHTYEGIAARDDFLAGWPVTPSPKLSIFAPNLAHAPFHAPPASLLPPGYQVGVSPRAKYEAMVLAYDGIIGKCLTRIDLATTLVVVVGDNGTPPVLAPDPAKAKGTTFERGCRVPLLIAGWAVAAPGRAESELVHLVDIWATLIEAGSGSIPGGSPYQLVSRSLMPTMRGEAHIPYHDSVMMGCRWGDQDGDVASVSQAGIKLRWLDPDGDGVANAEELYDLASDPMELANLVADPLRAADLAVQRAFLQASIP